MTVCGENAEVLSADSTQLVVKIPALVTEVTQGLYSLSESSIISGTPIGDIAEAASRAFDQTMNTFYISGNANCYVGYDFGSNHIADIHRIRYAPNPDEAVPASKIDGALFEVSDDGTTWSPLFTIDTTEFRLGYNVWDRADGDSHQHRYLRFSHDSTSGCFMAEI